MKSEAMPVGGGIQLNIRAITIALIVGATFIYVVYLWTVRGKGKYDEPGSLTQFHSWKSMDFVQIPISIVEKAPDITVHERRLSFEFDGKVTNDNCCFSVITKYTTIRHGMYGFAYTRSYN